jgi:paraquat-inducible protein B
MTDAEGADRREDRQAGAERLPEARRRKGGWAAWFWAIPLAALALVGWLAMKEWVIDSGDVTVIFARAEGLSPGAAVRYRGASVGRVRDIRLTDDLAHVKVVLRMEGAISNHIGAGTLFWIERPGLASGQIKNLIAGASVGVQPADGQQQESFNGLEEPPVLPAYQPGRSFVLTSEDAGGLSPGAPVLFRGVEVGRVLGTRLAAAKGDVAQGDTAKRQVEVSVLVEAKYADLVRQGSAFWQAGRLSVSMTGGLDVDLPSLQSLISGAVAFDTPEAFAGAPAGPETVFRLYGSRDAAKAAPGGPVFPYFVRFPKAIGGLGPGAAVTLEGRQIGRVARAGLDIDAETGNITTPVEIGIDALALDPQAAGTANTRDALGERLNQAVAKLVQNGLRAKAVSSGFLSTGKSVELAMTSDAKPASLDQTHEPPAIPAASSEIPKPPPLPPDSGKSPQAPPASAGTATGEETPPASTGTAIGQ